MNTRTPRSRARQALALGLLLGLTPPAIAQHPHPTMDTTMDTTTTTERNKAAARSIYEHLINDRAFGLLPTVIADDFEADGGIKGVDGFRQNVQSIIAGFPDIRFTVEDVVAEGDKVVVRWSWKGTNTASFRGYPVSGNAVTNEGVVIYLFRDGKAVRSWLQSDRLGALLQIGVIPKDVLQGPPARTK